MFEMKQEIEVQNHKVQCHFELRRPYQPILSVQEMIDSIRQSNTNLLTLVNLSTTVEEN